MSRATFAPTPWFERAAPLVGPGGLVLVASAGPLEEPFARSARAGGRLEERLLRLPSTGAPRHLSLVTVPTRSIPDDVLDPRIKHRSRLHWHVAEREARKIDATASAVLTDHEGHLTETAAGNIWFVRGNRLFTPSRHILEGVSRGVVLELADEAGLTTNIGDYDAMELAAADEAFVTSTPACLLPVTKFNGQPIGNGQPGPLFQQLIERWNGLVSLNIAEQMRRGASDRNA